ncbi:MAG: Ig-like domain-containing protein [Bacteroidales bacterium]|nr:Ig-like domain-containing protein [Bacteroidales bacterium]
MKSKIIFLLALISLFSCTKDNGTEEETVYVSFVAILGSNITSGTTGQMSVEVFPTDATNKEVSWTCSDASIATISSSGLLTALQNGTVTITATAIDQNVVSATKDITISSFYEGPTYEYMVSNSTELYSALAYVKAGETIFLNGGVYTLTSGLGLSISGTSGNEIVILGQTDGASRAKLDFSSMSESSSNRGISVSGSYWHIKGIDVVGAGDNGMFISGNNNVIEFCTFSENRDTGLQIGNGASNNTILNCDSYYNADSSIENADGFACKMDAGTGNKFIGCRAWQNLDDGWDGYLRGNDNITTTYENCWAIKNGYLKDGTIGGGDGNGFKTGGSDDKLLKHNAIYKNCIAVGNTHDGFDHNSNRGTVTIYNCSAYDNGKNYSFSTTNALEKLIIKNSNSLGSYGSTSATVVDVTHNSWLDGITASADDFESIDYSQLLTARKEDGSLPVVSFFHLKAGSDLIDKGVDVGLPFNGSAPDLGAFEY